MFLESIQLHLHRELKSYDTDGLEKFVEKLDQEGEDKVIEEENFNELKNAVDDLLKTLKN